ncbi:MAG TPA: hypothetical protein VNL16_00135 [Chloroflexota bacterium]|nr:hypothetical protein [Chloroflexota bacterium]
MTEENLRVTRARLRTEVRDLDAQIERIRTDDRMFRRYGFGSDLHDIQLVALQAQRQDLLANLAQAGTNPPTARRDRGRRGSWLLLPPALVALAVRSVFPRRRSAPRLA